MVHFKAALEEHFFRVALAQRIAQIPSHRLYDQLCLELAAFEVILRLTLQLLDHGIQNHDAELPGKERRFITQIQTPS